MLLFDDMLSDDVCVVVLVLDMVMLEGIFCENVVELMIVWWCEKLDV